MAHIITKMIELWRQLGPHSLPSIKLTFFETTNLVITCDNYLLRILVSFQHQVTISLFSKDKDCASLSPRVEHPFPVHQDGILKTESKHKNTYHKHKSQYIGPCTHISKSVVGLTPCRQPRPTSRREHVNVSSNYKLFIKACTAQQKKCKITSGLTVGKRCCK